MPVGIMSDLEERLIDRNIVLPGRGPTKTSSLSMASWRGVHLMRTHPLAGTPNQRLHEQAQLRTREWNDDAGGFGVGQMTGLAIVLPVCASPRS